MAYTGNYTAEDTDDIVVDGGNKILIAIVQFATIIGLMLGVGAIVVAFKFGKKRR